jgi:hypothetical protein
MKLLPSLLNGAVSLLVPVVIYGADANWQSQSAENLGKAGTESPNGV